MVETEREIMDTVRSQQKRSHLETWFIIENNRTNPREEGYGRAWLLKAEEATIGYEELKMLAQDRSSWRRWRWNLPHWQNTTEEKELYCHRRSRVHVLLDAFPHRRTICLSSSSSRARPSVAGEGGTSECHVAPAGHSSIKRPRRRRRHVLRHMNNKCTKLHLIHALTTTFGKWHIRNGKSHERWYYLSSTSPMSPCCQQVTLLTYSKFRVNHRYRILGFNVPLDTV